MKKQEENFGIDEARFRGNCMEIEPSAEFEEAFAKSVSEGIEAISEAVAPILRIFLSEAMMVDNVAVKSRMDSVDAKPLQQGLEKILGFGAKVFEKKMLTSLQAKLGISYEIERNFQFSREVENMKKVYTDRITACREQVTFDAGDTTDYGVSSEEA